LVQNFDWFYFKLALVVSGMYLFDLVAIGAMHGHLAIMASTFYTDVLNFPVLTLVYIGALFEFFLMKHLAGAWISRLRRKDAF
jgi:hypothetical protein